MLTALRQRLSTYRNASAPLASLADFGLWTLRTGLPVRGRKFWLVAALLGFGALAALFAPWSWLRGLALIATLGMGTLVGLMLVLSYVRTMIKTQNATLERGAQALSTQLARHAGEQISNRRADQQALRRMVELQFEARGTPEAQRAATLVDMFDSDFMRAVADAQDALAAKLDALSARTDALAQADGEALASLRADLAALDRRLEGQRRRDDMAFDRIAGRADAPSAGTGTAH